MIIFRAFVFIFMAFVGFLALTNAQAINQPPVAKDDIDSDEYAIYTALIKDWFGGNDFRTITAIREVNGCLGVTRNIDPENAKISELKLAQITADCFDKKARHLTVPRLALGKKVILLSEREMKSLFADDCEIGWKKFYKQYPKSTGQVYFSRVGFDDERRFAAVSFGFQRECLFGEGYIIFLERVASGWRTIYKHSTWVS